MHVINARQTALVDKFVYYVNSTLLEDDDAPEELCTGEVTDSGFQWKITKFDSNSWFDAFISKQPRAFPVSFQYLMQRYRFLEFSVGKVEFYANTGQSRYWEFVDRFDSRKKGYSWFELLNRHRYLQIAHSSYESFDPICVDLTEGDAESGRLVQLDHESILMSDRIRVTRHGEIAPSFDAFLEQSILDNANIK